MSRPRMGTAFIIDNVSHLVPGTDSDVRALQDAYETVGFDVTVRTNCNVKVLLFPFHFN